MKMYVKPSMNVIELQLKENIAAVPTTVYKGKKDSFAVSNENLALSYKGTGLHQSIMNQYGISLA